jgi:hypothetical protein
VIPGYFGNGGAGRRLQKGLAFPAVPEDDVRAAKEGLLKRNSQ